MIAVAIRVADIPILTAVNYRSGPLEEPAFDLELDARGLMCPEPVMLLHGKMSELVAGKILKVVATDPSTTRDVPRFCQFLHHELLLETQSGKEYVFFIRCS